MICAFTCIITAISKQQNGDPQASTSSGNEVMVRVNDNELHWKGPRSPAQERQVEQTERLHRIASQNKGLCHEKHFGTTPARQRNEATANHKDHPQQEDDPHGAPATERNDSSAIVATGIGTPPRCTSISRKLPCLQKRSEAAQVKETYEKKDLSPFKGL